MSAAVRQALVSFWNHKDSTADKHFVGSGVFVADKTILTASHAIPDDRRIWVRAAAGGIQSMPLVGPVQRHALADVALVCVGIMPHGATALDCDPHTSYETANGRLFLSGSFEGRPEEPQALAVLSFDPHANYYLSSVKQPVGHSGSAICHGQRLWGIAIQHYADPNVHRGCILAVSQFWDWLEPLLPVPHLTRADKPAAAAAPGTGAPSIQQIERFRGKLAAALSHSALANLETLPLTDGLPGTLHASLQRADSGTGPSCVDELVRVTRAIGEALAEQQLPALSAAERAGVRRRLLSAMGSAARMCLDSTLVPSGTRTELASVDVPADTAQGATLAMRDEPDKSWAFKIRAGLPSLVDPHAIELPIELGEGRDAQRELAKAVCASLSQTGEVPKEITVELLAHLEGLAYNEAAEGRARFLVLGRNDTAKLAPSVQEWLRQTLGVGTLRLSGSNGRLFLFPENRLFGRLQEFLRLLDKPEWKA